MQLGMIGLGRMGANMVRRLLARAAINASVFDMSAKAVAELVEGEGGRRGLAGRARQEADEAARGLADGAGRRRSTRPSPISLPHLERGDILIDGGNSYYIDDIRRAKELARQGHPLRRRRHQRRRLGAGARLLHDDRRRDRTSVKHLDPIFATLAPGPRRHPAHAGTREGRAARPSRAICIAARTAPAISSRWCTTASNTA